MSLNRTPLQFKLVIVGLALTMVIFDWFAVRAEGASLAELLDQMQIPQSTGGWQAPDFQLTSLDGVPVSLEKLQGKVVLIFFWASW